MKKGYPIDSKEGREAFTRGGWDKIPDSVWREGLEALKKYKVPKRFLKASRDSGLEKEKIDRL